MGIPETGLIKQYIYIQILAKCVQCISFMYTDRFIYSREMSTVSVDIQSSLPTHKKEGQQMKSVYDILVFLSKCSLLMRVIVPSKQTPNQLPIPSPKPPQPNTLRQPKPPTTNCQHKTYKLNTKAKLFLLIVICISNLELSAFSIVVFIY